MVGKRMKEFWLTIVVEIFFVANLPSR